MAGPGSGRLLTRRDFSTWKKRRKKVSFPLFLSTFICPNKKRKRENFFDAHIYQRCQNCRPLSRLHNTHIPNPYFPPPHIISIPFLSSVLGESRDGHGSGLMSGVVLKILYLHWEGVNSVYSA